MASSSYTNTGRNELCKSNSISYHEEDLTTGVPDGIHVDKQFSTQDIFVQDKFLGVCHYYFNNKYVDLNKALESLNNERCSIYQPIRFKPDTDWYTDELMLEKEGY